MHFCIQQKRTVMKLFTSIYRNMVRSQQPCRPRLLQKELRLNIEGIHPQLLMKMSAAIQNLLSQHEGTTNTEWMGIHQLENEYSVWFFEVYPYAYYNVLLELQTILEDYFAHCKCLDRSTCWDFRMLSQ